MPAALDHELQKLLVGTNDQRRRVGQALYHFYRTLIFWMPKGRGFHEITRTWAAGGAAIFDVLAGVLKELGGPAPDAVLRNFTARVLDELAEDLERGDHMLVPFLRWLETLFPELTDMIRAEHAASRIYDYELARELAALFSAVAQASRGDAIRRLRESAEGLRPSGPGA